MKFPLSWIKEYLDLKASPEEVSDALTLAGLEVEGMEKRGDDVVFDVSLTPNLGHCMSIVGIARELAAHFHLSIQRKKIVFKEISETTKKNVTVKIEDPLQCYHYSCRLVKNVQVAPSPKWLKERLEASGLRSINNVVDIGNFVMLEWGHPLHLFDFDQLSGKTITAKAAAKMGKMQTLDEEEREVPDEVLMICDGKKPIAFAGVIGESETAISDKAKNVLIEAAVFTPEAVRKTSKLLSLRTESSIRFERGVDPLGIDVALDRAAQLLSEMAQGEVCKGTSECVVQKYEPLLLNLDPKRTNRLLGLYLSIREIAEILGRLEIQVLKESEDAIQVQIPSYRNDIKKEIDLVEEVGRIFGFNHIPRGLPKHTSSTMTHAPLFVFEEEIRTKLMGQGLHECLTCDLISPTMAEITLEKALSRETQIHVLHPRSIDQSILRPSLLPGLLEVVRSNLDKQNSSLAVFEVGHIHFKDGDKYFEETAAGILITGEVSPYHFERKDKEVDFFDLKGHVENLLVSIGISEALFEISHLQNFHPNRQAKIFVGKRGVGALGEVHPSHLKELGVDQKVYFAELQLNDLLSLKKNIPVVKEPPSFPGSARDWTITLAEKMPIGTILHAIKSYSSPILENVYLLDLYKSDKIGKNRKNATFRFQYRDPKKTIEYEDVEKAHKELTEHLAEKFADVVP